MNPTQWQTSLAGIISFLAGLAAGRGLFGFDQATWITIITAVVGFAGVIWTAFTTRKSSIVTAVADLPEVKSITLDPTVSNSSSVAAATPANVTVGTK